MWRRYTCSIFLPSILFFATLNSPKVYAQNTEAPVVVADGSDIYCPLTEQPIVQSFSITASSTTRVEAFYIQISSGFIRNQDRLILRGNHPNVRSNWNAAEAKLTLLPASGNAIEFTDLTAAVYDVVFYSSNPNITTEKGFSLTAGGANYLPSTGHYYKYIAQPNITWTQARAAAAAQQYYGLQGYLTTILSEEEARLVGELSPGVGWIGGTDQDTEGVWKWATGPEAGTIFWNGEANGSSPNYAKWNTGEPNNAGNEDYAHITDNSVGIRGSWNDLPNTTSTSGPYQAKGYLVEFGGMPGDPELNISDNTRLVMARILDTANGTICENGTGSLTVTTTTGNAFWYDTQTDGNLLYTGINFTTAVNTTTTFWVQAQPSNCGSATRTPVRLDYYALPQIKNTLITIEQCDEDGDNDGFTQFDLTENEPLISLNHLQETFEYYRSNSYTAASQIQNPQAFTNEAFEQRIYVKVISPQGCISYSEILLRLGASEIDPDFMLYDVKCETVTKTLFDGLEYWPRSTFEDIRNALIASNTKFANQNVRISLHKSQQEALLIENSIDIEAPDFSFYMDTPYQQEIWALIESVDLDEVSCIGLKQVALLEVIPPPAIAVTTSTLIYCTNLDPIALTAPSTDDRTYTYIWRFGEEEISPDDETVPHQIWITQGGEYTVTASTQDGNACSITKRFLVEESSIASLSLSDIKIEDLNNKDENSIEIATDNLGIGEYEYALDNPIGPYQDEPFFDAVSSGIHTVYIRDKNGCGVAGQEVSVLGYDAFFTPNGDGINDTWIIRGINEQFQSQSRIYIYDRYGKLLDALDPQGQGWNGNHKGLRLPEDSYWFRFDAEDGRSLMGHFSLIR